ncbi:protoporphyrinogen oxidase [Aplysia californica]|uniref:Protoporphyrinogen oxidase n=1 Tax=Aplysia californica TaxID=6500 RepID=A0ABM0ZYF2_APLCA|nr:protoporphyrinogen oxidase [Aplysia californica]XP_012937097.1 protoporphyrinogen oxidase [Aplysia californica]
MATAVVIGGGASGLASAYYIQKFLPQFTKVIVLEGSNRLGGWVNTTQNPDGSIFEHGPRSLRPVGEQGSNTLQLAEELGLERDILPIFRSDAAAKNRYLYAKGKLCALPNSLMGVVRTIPPFSKPLIRSFALEPLRRRSKTPDETIHSFFSRRLGGEFADIAIDAMCRGIFAGDCRKLSIEACFPPLHEMEKSHGSIVTAALFGSKGAKPAPSGLAKKAAEEKWASWSLARGLQQLTDAMADAVMSRPGVEVRTDSRCIKLEPKENDKMLVQTNSDSITADLVVSAVYSKDLASVLPNAMSDLKEDLSSLPAVSVVTVNLEYKDNVLPVKGFGHLLPSSESGPILGIVYDSCTFPEHNRRGAPDSTRITVMLGGSWFNRLLGRDGELPSGQELVWLATEAAAKHLDIKAHPIRSQAMLQKECIPQYRVGHASWLRGVEEKISSARLPLKLVGSSYRGPAINDCINNARKAVLSLKQS